jgi:alpha-galactosidase
MTKIDPQTLSILQNPAVLAVSQDPAASTPVRQWRYFVDDIDENGKGEIQMYSGALSGGDQLVLLLNAGSKAREMNATLVDIFWESGPKGTAKQVNQHWDVYDLWANRMSNEDAAAIINGTYSGPSPYNLTAMGGAQEVYSRPVPSNSKVLMGSKVGSVQPSGTVTAHVRPHGVAMLRLRATDKKDEL